MKKLTLIALMAVLMVMSSCSSLTFSYDYDKSIDFTKFKTYSYYGWADNSGEILSPFDKERIEQSFGNEFKERGLTFQKEGGDLTVVLYIVTKQQQQTTATTTGMGGMYNGYGGYGGFYGYGPGWGWGGGMQTTTFNTYDYTVGTLVCDVFDTHEKKLIWEGVGKGTVDSNPQERTKRIPMIVDKIMANYPVKPISTKVWRRAR
ncbi:MAG TPA: DUF4136 domain-containing protein, partial [Bacteroidales bacterium]|jgi:hypothetical protein|nr:DUF4136 domain-containing protein [Bacteroidales bacterium]|tara:strand:+ start:368 stop:979 length:612 start_codon:yes stop_codon:yes gene_type:complete